MPRTPNPQKAQLWRQRFADFERSQLSVAQFCQSIGCSVPTFYLWKRKIDAPRPSSSFLRVQTLEPQPAYVEIKIPNGVLIRVPVSAIGSLGEILQQVA